MWPFKPVLKLHFSPKSEEFIKELVKHLHYIRSVSQEVGLLTNKIVISDEYVVSLMKSYSQLTESILSRFNRYHKKRTVNLDAEVNDSVLLEFISDICQQHNIEYSKITAELGNQELKREIVQWYHIHEYTAAMDRIIDSYDPIMLDLSLTATLLSDPPDKLSENFGKYYNEFLTAVSTISKRCTKEILPWIKEDRHTLLKHIDYMSKHSLARKL